MTIWNLNLEDNVFPDQSHLISEFWILELISPDNSVVVVEFQV